MYHQIKPINTGITSDGILSVLLPRRWTFNNLSICMFWLLKVLSKALNAVRISDRWLQTGAHSVPLLLAPPFLCPSPLSLREILQLCGLSNRGRPRPSPWKLHQDCIKMGGAGNWNFPFFGFSSKPWLAHSGPSLNVYWENKCLKPNADSRGWRGRYIQPLCFFKDLIFYLCTWMFYLYICICNMDMPGRPPPQSPRIQTRYWILQNQSYRLL